MSEVEDPDGLDLSAVGHYLHPRREEEMAELLGVSADYTQVALCQ
jgi:hypothetical protein